MFVTGMFARRIMDWACATTMHAEELPLQVPEQAILWAAGRSTSASYAPRE